MFYTHLLYNYCHCRVDIRYKIVFFLCFCFLSNFSCKFVLYYCGTKPKFDFLQNRGNYYSSTNYILTQFIRPAGHMNKLKDSVV